MTPDRDDVHRWSGVGFLSTWELLRFLSVHERRRYWFSRQLGNFRHYCKDVSWVAGQCYVIDIFLWHMARHGYVLRKSDAKLPFDDIHATNTTARDRSRDLMIRTMGLTPIESVPPQAGK